MLARPRQDLDVWCGFCTDGGPVNGLEPVVREPLDPAWRQVPVRAASRLAERNFDFLGPPSGVGECFGYVLGFQVGVLAEDLVARSSRSDEPDHRAYRYAHAPDTRLSAHYGGVTSDPCQLWHGAL